MGVNVEIIHMVLQIFRTLNNVTWIFGEIPFISHLGAIFSLPMTVEQQIVWVWLFYASKTKPLKWKTLHFKGTIQS